MRIGQSWSCRSITEIRQTSNSNSTGRSEWILQVETKSNIVSNRSRVLKL
jgi:hypothetical protein